MEAPILKIPPDKFLALSKTVPVIDVRAPKEFRQGHIPGAISLPLFDDE
jgi:tRNA 2-selenouridine synthase